MSEKSVKIPEANEYGEVINHISNVITTEFPESKETEGVDETEVVDETVVTEEVKTGAGPIGTNSGGEETAKTVVPTDKK